MLEVVLNVNIVNNENKKTDNNDMIFAYLNSLSFIFLDKNDTRY